MNQKIKTPGMANIFWMPIQTRTEMLTTGFRSILGIKVFGPDLATIENVAVQIEKALSDLPHTRSAFAERTTGGYFLDFSVNRQQAARHGLTVGDVNDIIETAIGGKTIATTVEGRERYPINVRYARDFREDLDSLKRVLVPAPMGTMDRQSGGAPERMNAPTLPRSDAPTAPQIPIGALADIDFKTGPPSVRTENGQLVGFVFVDIDTDDLNGYVQGASRRIREQVQFPTGYYIQWAGQFQYLQEAEKRLKIVIPFTLLIIFMLIYLNTKSVTKTFIVLLAVPFSLVGAFWFLHLLGYNMSVAVWVGLIALAGLDAETGVIMLLYLDHAWEKFCAQRRMNTMGDLREAVIEGAVQRIRPKVMTICAILFGLLPIMWAPTTQSGADVMKRIAAPMIGGVVTSGVLELLIYPAIFVLWRRRHLPRETRNSMQVTEISAPTMPVRKIGPEQIVGRRPRGRKAIVGVAVIILLAIGGYFAWQKLGPMYWAKNRPLSTPRVHLTEPQVDAVQKFFVAADAVTTSLSADKLDQFNNTTKELQPAVTQLGQAFDSGHPWHTLVDQIQAVSNLPQANSLEAARQEFHPFTARVVDLAKAARDQGAPFSSLKIYKCPMAPKPGQTSFWIQLQGPLRNPFYGSEMLDCGSEVK